MRTLEDLGGLHGGDVLREYLGAANVVGDYIVSQQPGGFQALSLSDKPSFSHGTDAAAAVQGAINVLGSGGGTILLAGDLAWGSVPGLPRGITGKPLTIRGLPGSKVTLSAAGPRLFDFAKQADHDTFQNIEITDLLVDVNNVGGRHHILLGTYVGGATTTRINVQDVAIRRVNWINAPVDPTTTNHRLGVWIVVNQPGASEGTQNTVRRVVVEDCRGDGGNAGFTIGGSGGSGGGPDLNVVYDEILFRRCRHSCLSAPAGAFSSSNFQIGSRAKGGTVGSAIQDCYGEYSGDVGIEVDNGTVSVVGCTILDAFNENYLHTNFNSPAQGIQTVTFDRCISRAVAISNIGYAVRTASQATPVPFGNVNVLNCSAYVNNGTEGRQGSALLRDDPSSPAGSFTTRLVVRNFYFEHVIGGTTTTTVRPFSVKPAAGVNIVEIDGFHANISGSYSTGTLTYNIVDLSGATMRYAVRGVRADVSTTGVQTNTFRLVNIGEFASSVLTGRHVFRECGYSSISGGGTSPFGILVRATGTLTINGKIILENNDFSQMAGGTDFSLDATQLGKIHARANTYRVAPAPTTLTGLVSNTGKLLGVHFDCILQCTPASGAAITACDYSTNGGTTYSNLLTQASGAMPASPTMIEVGPVPPDALFRATFATTQPTVNLIPANP